MKNYIISKYSWNYFEVFELFLRLEEQQKVRQRLTPVNTCQQEKEYRTWVMYTVCVRDEVNPRTKELHKALCIFQVCSFIWTSGALIDIFKSLNFPICFNANTSVKNFDWVPWAKPCSYGCSFPTGVIWVLLHVYNFQPSLRKSPH